MMVGSPVYPTPLRMIRAVESEGCTLLKTGSAVVRQLMTDPSNAAKVDAIDTSTLRCATFCAEPVSVEVHKYSHDHITEKFINSYWATEHGAMVFSRDVAAPNGLTRRGVISRTRGRGRFRGSPPRSTRSPATWSSRGRTHRSRSPSLAMSKTFTTRIGAEICPSTKRRTGQRTAAVSCRATSREPRARRAAGSPFTACLLYTSPSPRD